MPERTVHGMPAGAPVLPAGELAGWAIPRSCDHERLSGDAAWPIQGLIRHFRPERERWIAENRVMREAAE